MKEATASRGALFPIHPLVLTLVCIGAFAVYWSSSFVLDTPLRDGRMQFGADTLDFAPLAKGEISNRNLRLHPLTISLSLAWMKAVSPLTAWLEPAHLHRALFVLIGALGAEGVCGARRAQICSAARRHLRELARHLVFREH